MDNQLCVIVKRGLYYRKNWQGYTSQIAEAGKYEFREAEQHADKAEGISIQRLSCACGEPANHEGWDGEVVCSGCLSAI